MSVNVRLTIDPTTVVTIPDAEYLDLLRQRLIYAVVGGEPIDYSQFTPAEFESIRQTARGVRVYSEAAMPKWFAAIRRVGQGTDHAKLAVVGDSTSAAYGVDRARSWPSRFRDRLSQYIPTHAGLNIPDNLLGNSTQWSMGTWSTVFGPGSGALYAEPAQGTRAMFTPGELIDTVDVWWYKAIGKGTFVFEFDGKATTIVTNSTDGAGGWQKTTLKATTAAANLAMVFNVPTVGPVHVMVDAYYAGGPKGVRVANLGVTGSTTQTWASIPYSVEAISAWAPDLTVIMLGINDANASPPRTVEQWSADMTTLITEAKKSGDVILASVVPSKGAGWNNDLLGREKAYRQAIPGLAKANDAAFVDVLDAVGQYDPALYVDEIHPNARGHAQLSRIMANAFTNL